MKLRSFCIKKYQPHYYSINSLRSCYFSPLFGPKSAKIITVTEYYLFWLKKHILLVLHKCTEWTYQHWLLTNWQGWGRGGLVGTITTFGCIMSWSFSRYNFPETILLSVWFFKWYFDILVGSIWLSGIRLLGMGF